MIQAIIVILLFSAACGYLSWLVYRSFQAKTCETGCGKCSTIDLNKIEKAIRQKEMQLR